MRHLTDPLRFLLAFVTHPRQVGAVLPTSRAAVRDMLDLADVAEAELVVELGAGTGSGTGEILARLGPGARFVALEMDPRLAKLLDQRYPDPRLQLIYDSAEHALPGALDLAAQLDPGGEGQRRAHLVGAHGHQHIGEVEGRRPHLDQQLPRPGRRRRHLVQRHRRGVAELVHPPCAHGTTLPDVPLCDRAPVRERPEGVS